MTDINNISLGYGGPRRKKSRHKGATIIYLLFFAVITVLLVVQSYVDERAVFLFWTAILLAYGIFEIRLVSNAGGPLIFANPAVLATIISFGIYFGLSNFIYFTEDGVASLQFILGIKGFYWMNTTLPYAVLGLFFMWRGFNSGVSKNVANAVWKIKFLRKLIREEASLNWLPIYFILGMSILSKLYRIKIGVYGFGSDSEEIYGLLSYIQYLHLIEQLGLLSFLALSIAHFSRRVYDPILQVNFVVFLVIQVAFGFLSGMKSNVLLPIVLVGLCQYVIKGKIPRKTMLIAVVMLMVAYASVTQFRETFHQDKTAEARNVSELAGRLVEEDGETKGFTAYIVDTVEEHYYQLFERVSMTPYAAVAIRHKEEVGLSEKDPEFAKNALLSPFYAYMPRVIWKTKPVFSVGRWVNVTVLGRSEASDTSIDITAVGYLYLAGGGLGIAIGFFVIGFLQRVIFSRLICAGAGGLMVALGLIVDIIDIPSSIPRFFMTILRFVPIYILVQAILLKRVGLKRTMYSV